MTQAINASNKNINTAPKKTDKKENNIELPSKTFNALTANKLNPKKLK